MNSLLATVIKNSNTFEFQTVYRVPSVLDMFFQIQYKQKSAKICEGKDWTQWIVFISPLNTQDSS